MQHQNALVAKYEVEDDLDLNFFEELKKMQSQPELLPDSGEHDVCLITNEPLNAFHVSLKCGHKFNYEPLYQEVLRQKGRLGIHNYHEKIEFNQIKCPYCRTMTPQLLPYIGQHAVIKRFAGVNSPSHMCMPGVKCCTESCHVNAFYEHDARQYCLRHYNIALKPKSKPKPKSNSSKSKTPNNDLRCMAEIQTGKNKGKRCALNASESGSEPPLCKKHSKCNVVLFKME